MEETISDSLSVVSDHSAVREHEDHLSSPWFCGLGILFWLWDPFFQCRHTPSSKPKESEEPVKREETGESKGLPGAHIL